MLAVRTRPMARWSIYADRAISLCVFWILAGGAQWAVGAERRAASLLWTVDLTTFGCPVPSFESEFDATRQAVFASQDRVVVSYPGRPSAVDGILQTPVCTLSLNAVDGSLVSERRQTVTIYRHPLVFPTAADQVILVTGGAVLLNSDLSEAGVSLDAPSAGRIQHVSPDGAVVAVEGNSRTQMLDTRTLQPTGVNLEGAVPVTITSRSASTNNAVWINNKPPQRFGSITTQSGSRPLLLQKCNKGFQADYLNENQMVITCVDSYQVQDEQGRVLTDQRFFGKRVRFGGVSRDGKRFIVVISKRGLFDPWPVSDEELQVYDLDQKKTIATIAVPHAAEGSWSALSPKGDFLLHGSTDGLRLYRIP